MNDQAPFCPADLSELDTRLIDRECSGVTTTMVTTISPRERELRGHDTRRYQLPMHNDSNDGPNPSGLCMCGCGQRTKIALASNTKRRIVRGTPLRFIHGHNANVMTYSDERRRNGSLAKMGDKNPRWKGGRTEDAGYISVKVGRDHPMADQQGYVKEHRLVLAAALGRYLSPDEDVHHLDLDRSNNTPENLIVVSRSQHMAIHRRITCGAAPLAAVTEVLA